MNVKFGGERKIIIGFNNLSQGLSAGKPGRSVIPDCSTEARESRCCGEGCSQGGWQKSQCKMGGRVSMCIADKVTRLNTRYQIGLPDKIQDLWLDLISDIQ